MFHRIFTSTQLSGFFRKANIAEILCLLALLIQNRYMPDDKTLQTIIENISNASLYIIALIIISQFVLLFAMHHKKFISHYKLIAYSIELLFATACLWLFIITHHMRESFIKFYSNTLIDSHHSLKITVLLFFIFIMLIIKLYNSMHENIGALNTKTLKEILYEELHIFLRQYMIICASFIGLLHFNKLNEFAASSLNYTKSMFILYSNIFGYALLTLTGIVIIIVIYKKYYQQKL